LIDKGIEIDKHCYFDEQALVIAVKEKNLTLVSYLAENGADVNGTGYQTKKVLDYAIADGNPEIVDYLKRQGAITMLERNERYKATMKLESEIKSALVSEDLEKVIELMSTQEVLVIQNKVLQTIAYVAAKNGHIQLIDKLLSNDVDFEIDSPINRLGQTILFVATIYSQNELITHLLSKGTNTYLEDINGKIAENFASKKSTKKLFNQWHKNTW
jgi:ankyrin repeat protein